MNGEGDDFTQSWAYCVGGLAQIESGIFFRRVFDKE